MAEPVVLDSVSALAFHGLTFASLQPLLLSAGNSGVTAVGVCEGGEPVGLALALHLPHKGRARVASLFVARPYRRKGHGTRLLAALEAALRDKGEHVVELGFQAARETSAAPPRMLERLGWPAAQPDRLVCRCDRRMLESPWLRREYTLPRDAQVVSWADVSPEEVAALEASQAKDPWVPASLRPWQYEGIAFNSVAMRYRGALMGWVLTQRFNSSTLVYSNSYMHPTLQRNARILPLYVEAVRRQAADPGLPNAVWVVPFAHPTMVRFVRTWMTPYMNTVEEHMVSVRELA